MAPSANAHRQPSSDAGDHEEADQRGGGPADRPERLEDHDQPPADACGSELAHVGRRDRQLRAQTEADEEAQHEQGARGRRRARWHRSRRRRSAASARRPGGVRTGRPGVRRASRRSPCRRSRPRRSTRSRLGVSSHCDASAAMTNEMSPTSIASSAQPSPEPVSSRRCRRVNGRSSSRSASDARLGRRCGHARHRRRTSELVSVRTRRAARARADDLGAVQLDRCASSSRATGCPSRTSGRSG